MKKTQKAQKGHLGKALLVGTALVSLGAVEASAVTGTGSMSAIVLAPITVANQANLHFGSITINPTLAGTVAVPATGGARVITGGVNLITGAALESPGALRVTAATNVAMDITMQAGPFTVTGPGPAMTVDGFNLVLDAGGTTADITIPTTATFIDVPVGATLNTATGALQTAGTYTGTYNVDVTYQ